MPIYVTDEVCIARPILFISCAELKCSWRAGELHVNASWGYINYWYCVAKMGLIHQKFV